MILCQSCYATFERSPTLPPETPAVHCPACATLSQVQQLDLYATRVGVASERRQETRRRRRKVETIRHPALG